MMETKDAFLNKYLSSPNVWREKQEEKRKRLNGNKVYSSSEANSTPDSSKNNTLLKSNTTKALGSLAFFWQDLREEAEVPIEPYEGEMDAVQEPSPARKLSRRSRMSLVMLFLLAPALIAFGILFLDDRKYLFISIVLLCLAMLPFFMIFEGRKPQARELVIIAVLTALTVAARAAFFMLPFVKPIAAMVIVSGVTFGPESGFLVGCLSMILSNFLFGQGPWTPWQMFTYGLIGFVAGTLFRKGLLKRTRPALCFYGFMSVIFIFGGIMNFASLVMYTSHITWQGLLAMYISGFPVDLVHAASTVVFLWFGSRPLIEKLERVKKKYGLMSGK